MITKQQLDKMIEIEAPKHATSRTLDVECPTWHGRYSSFKSGASFVSKILMAEIETLKMKVSVANSDYWFMINLIEIYGSDKDQTLKDCLERMKFRKQLFETTEKEE